MIIPDNEKLENIPPIILYIAGQSIANIPIGISTYNDAKEKYPQYFKDELEWEEKYNKVPQEVHDKFKIDYDKKSGYRKEPFNDKSDMMEYLRKNAGFLYDREEESDKLYGTYADIWNKHYGKYGLKRNYRN